MNLLDLVQECGTFPKKVSATGGGEYHSACPSCGGKDRFIVQPNENRYWCRRCNVKGDAIQFCRDFLGMDYPSACRKVGAECKKIPYSKSNHISPRFVPKAISSPSIEWSHQAHDFVAQSNNHLMKNLEMLNHIKSTRGLSIDSIRMFLLGWNPVNESPARVEWGLSREINDNGCEKKLWLPKGIVIPTIRNGAIDKLKIRRADWKEGDQIGKYIVISGSASNGSVFGNSTLPIVVLVEAELDAILVAQEVGDVCCSITMGGSNGRPDASTHDFLLSKKLILFALDFDEAGKNAYRFWKSTYANLRAWPVPREKSPCDAYLAGIDLRQWVLGGLRKYAS